MLKFMVFHEAQMVNTFFLDEPVITIGRLPENTIQLFGEGVSRRHLRIEQDTDGTSYILVDLHSLNGTYVSGRLVRKAPLQNGDTIVIGNFTIVYEQIGVQPVEAPRSSPPPRQPRSAPVEHEHQTRTMPSLPKNATVPAVPVLIEASTRQACALDKEYLTLGNDPSDDIRVEGHHVGKQQAFIRRSTEGWCIGTARPTNMLKVNGTLVKMYLLRDNDRIDIGETTFRYRENG